MIRRLWLSFALAALWLWASLVPQVTYSSASTGAPSGNVLIAWPGWSVQQDLGSLGRAVGRFRVWISSRPDGDPVTVWASLLDASTGEVLRQTTIDATPSSIRPRILDFPGYLVPSGQKLHLQLQVAEFEHGYVVYHLAEPQTGYLNLAVNNVSDAGDGPLAFSHLETGSGLRAGVLGQPSERARLVLAVLFGGLAVGVHPRVAGGIRRFGRLAKLRVKWSRFSVAPAEEATDRVPTLTGRILSTPWYPWLLTVVPILHFMTNNPLHFSLSETVVPIGTALVLVSASVIGLRLVLDDWYRPAAASGGVIVMFFAYGHVDRAFSGALDDRILFPTTIVLGAIAVAAAVTANGWARKGTQFSNVAAAALLLFPVAEIASEIGLGFERDSESGQESVASTAHLPSLDLAGASDERPDIYYIVLDAYSRDEQLAGFDNSRFLHELERRGFYIASDAISNYNLSIHSIPSSLNLSYLHDLESRTPASEIDLRKLAQFNALAAILQDLGYAYVHLESGYEITDKSPVADVSVSFTRAGAIVSEREGGTSTVRYSEASSRGSPTDGRFLRALLQTTALRPLLVHRPLAGDDDPYDWWVADRALEMFGFLSSPIQVGRPKFVFAHIVKPHLPATFDKYGNKVVGLSDHSGFDDDHDPSVPNAYIGQLIYVNELVINMVDEILGNNGDGTVIVLSGDHGTNRSHDILAAFRLPGGRDEGLYRSISSVNHFRYILDQYFDLGIGLVEDRTEIVDPQLRDFRRLAEVKRQ